MVLEVPTGILSDRWDRKRVLPVSSALWVASMALLAAATDFGGLLAAELVAAASCSLQSGTVESLLHETGARGSERLLRLLAVQVVRLVPGLADGRQPAGWLAFLTADRDPVALTGTRSVLSTARAASPNLPPG